MGKFVNFLYGKDRILVLRHLAELIKEFKLEKKDIIRYDLKEDKESIIFEDLITISFFSDIKVLIIDHFDYILTLNQVVVKKWLDFFVEENKHVFLFMIIDEIFLNKDNTDFKKIIDNSQTIKVEEINEKNAKNFIKKQFKKNDYIISAITVEKIFDKIKFDLSRLTQELDKLMIYCYESKKIQNEDVENVINLSYDTSMYVILDLILSKNKKILIENYMNLLKNNFDHLRILFSINSSFKNLFYAKIMIKEGYNDIDIQRELNLTSGNFYYLSKNISRVSFDFLEKNLMKIADIDFGIKNGKLNKADAVDLFILEM